MPYLQFNDFADKGFTLVSFSGREAISELFYYELVLESNIDDEIKATDIIGQDVSFCVNYSEIDKDNESRYIHGIVNSLKIQDTDAYSGVHRYVVELVPSLWFLNKKSNFRIFENKKTSEIIKSVLSESRINTTMPAGKIKREHCIQYLETDYEFVTRLMADEGFLFYFEHSSSEHKLIVKDSNQYLNCGTLDVSSLVTSWSQVFNHISNKWEAGDYSYSDTADSLAENKKSTIKGLDNLKHTQVVTAANVAGEGDKTALKRQAVIMTGREDARHQVIEVSSFYHHICAGSSFKVSGNEGLSKDIAGEFVVIEASHQSSSDGLYSNSFKCIPASMTYCGEKPSPRPIVNGPMTAKVVESGGDDLGRVKVKFLYEGADSEKTKSCWIRVAQVIGGNKYGAMFTPRIDEEVVVTFINGNPDRPLITGTLYNGSNNPPKDYIGEKGKPTRNGFLTSFDGKKFNELYFEDKPGEELFYVRTDNNYERLVEANDTLTITKGERKIVIKEGDENETLEKGNKTTTLTKGDQTITLTDGNQKIELKSGDREVKVSSGEIKEDASKNIDLKAGESLKVDASSNVELKAGSNVELKATSNVDLDASSNITLSANSKIELKVGGNSMKMDNMGITLTVGGNSVKIEQSGITVKGIMVTVEGSAKADLKSPLTTVSGDGMLTVKGGVVMIN